MNESVFDLVSLLLLFFFPFGEVADYTLEILSGHHYFDQWLPPHAIHVKSLFFPGATTCFQLRICGMNHPPIDRWWFSIRNVPWLPSSSLSCLVDTLLEKCIDGIATLVCYHSTTRYHQTFYTYLWFDVVVVILLEQHLLFLLFPSWFLYLLLHLEDITPEIKIAPPREQGTFID